MQRFVGAMALSSLEASNIISESQCIPRSSAPFSSQYESLDLERCYGERYKPEVSFNLNAGRIKEGMIIELCNLGETLNEYVENEMIMWVGVYTHKLNAEGWGFLEFLFYHSFIVFSTGEWWYSVEKNDAHVVLQRSKSRSAVLDFVNSRRRSAPTTLCKAKRARMKIKDFVGMLCHTSAVSRKYHWTDHNCQHFSDMVYDYMPCWTASGR